MRVDNFYFVVSNLEESIKFYENLLNEKPTNITGTRWADWGNADNKIYFGIITEEAAEAKCIRGNNGVLGLYTDDINEAFKRCQNIGATILYEPEFLADSPDHYACFAITDPDGNKIEIAYYDK